MPVVLSHCSSIKVRVIVFNLNFGLSWLRQKTRAWTLDRGWEWRGVRDLHRLRNQPLTSNLSTTEFPTSEDMTESHIKKQNWYCRLWFSFWLFHDMIFKLRDISCALTSNSAQLSACVKRTNYSRNYFGETPYDVLLKTCGGAQDAHD